MSRSDTITFGAVGDIAIQAHTARRMADEGMDWPFQAMSDTLAEVDVLFGNLESPIVSPALPADERDPRAVIADVPGDEFADALKNAGFDYLCLANNHVLDGGRICLEHTINALDRAGIAHGGACASPTGKNNPVILEKKGASFGFLSYAEDNNYSLGHTDPGPAYFDMDRVIDDIRGLRGSVDFVVASVHADIEFTPTPAYPRMEKFRRMADCGANIVLGHHPHVPQGIERRGDALIAYSLGNFIFEPHSDRYLNANGPRTAHSFVLMLELDKGGIESFRRIPVFIALPPDERPVHAPAELKLPEYFRLLDETLSNEDEVKRIWRETAVKHLEIFLGKLKNADTETALNEIIPRMLLVAENRECFNEIFETVKERWIKRQRQKFEYQRPNFEFDSTR